MLPSWEITIAEMRSNKELGRPEEMLERYERALDANPRDGNAWNNKGVALRALGRPEEALKCFDRALDYNPREADLWVNQGVALEHLGSYGEAKQAFEEAARLGDTEAAQELENLKKEGH